MPKESSKEIKAQILRLTTQQHDDSQKLKEANEKLKVAEQEEMEESKLRWEKEIKDKEERVKRIKNSRWKDLSESECQEKSQMIVSEAVSKVAQEYEKKYPHDPTAGMTSQQRSDYWCDRDL